MSLFSQLATLIKRVVVDLPGAAPQVLHAGGQVLPDVEYFEPQGLHFRPPKAAQGLALSPGAVVSSAVTINLSGPVPNTQLDPGEGGLHYLGSWKLFLAKDGTLHWGDKDPGDWVALASKVDAELTKIKADLDAVRTGFAAHTHTTNATMGASDPATISTPVGSIAEAHAPASVASSTVRAK